MTDNVYVYFCKFPSGIKEAVAPCPDGYTIWIDESIDKAQQIKALNHALYHIKNGDLESGGDVNMIETRAHNESSGIHPGII